MKRIGLTIIVIMLLSARSCSGQELPIITLRRTACLGTCPVYSLEIFEDGRLQYKGEQYVDAIGSRKAQISPEAVKKLIGGFAKIHYFELNDVYETHTNPDGTIEWITDLPTTYTALRVGNRTKSVKDYAFSPESLRTLELEIDRVANTHRWIHSNDDLKDWQVVAADVYGRTKPEMNLLMQSAGTGDEKKLLREHNAGNNVDAQDETGWTALMLAAVQCQEGSVRRLLSWNAKTTLRDKNGDDALIGAASGFCLDPRQKQAQSRIIKQLIARGADPNTQDNLDIAPLMLVTTYGNIPATQALLDAGARLDIKDRNGKTPLDHAKDSLKKYNDHDWDAELRSLVELLERTADPVPPKN